MKTRAFIYAELPVTTNGQNRQRRMFTEKTHTGFKIESHQTEIAPGEVNHPPHKHLREEMMLIRVGTMELTIAGKAYRLGPGDVGVIGSNEMHNAKNVGTTRAQYFIVNIGRDDVQTGLEPGVRSLWYDVSMRALPLSHARPALTRPRGRSRSSAAPARRCACSPPSPTATASWFPT